MKTPVKTTETKTIETKTKTVAAKSTAAKVTAAAPAPTKAAAKAKPAAISAPQVVREGRTCSWPIGDPSKSDFHFCGNKRDAGQSYCAEHISLAYQKGTKRGKTLSHSLSVASRSATRSR